MKGGQGSKAQGLRQRLKSKISSLRVNSNTGKISLRLLLKTKALMQRLERLADKAGKSCCYGFRPTTGFLSKTEIKDGVKSSSKVQ